MNLSFFKDQGSIPLVQRFCFEIWDILCNVGTICFNGMPSRLIWFYIPIIYHVFRDSSDSFTHISHVYFISPKSWENRSVGNHNKPRGAKRGHDSWVIRYVYIPGKYLSCLVVSPYHLMGLQSNSKVKSTNTYFGLSSCMLFAKLPSGNTSVHTW